MMVPESSVPVVAPNLGSALESFSLAQTLAITCALQRRKDAHKGIHEFRKAIRRLRSVLLLGGSLFGELGMTIDAFLRRLCRSLSALRDAHVAIEQTRLHSGNASDVELKALWKRISKMLVDAQARLLRHTWLKDPRFGRRQLRVEKMHAAILKLPWATLEATTVCAEVNKTRKRVDRAARRAEEKPTLLHRHRWRRRLRRHRMQIMALATMLDDGSLPATVDGIDRIAHVIAHHVARVKHFKQRIDALGAELDLQILRTALRRLPKCRDRDLALTQLRLNS